jgi:hypothetical protein
MISLSMVARNVFSQRSPQRALTKEDDLRQTLLYQETNRVEGGRLNPVGFFLDEFARGCGNPHRF